MSYIKYEEDILVQLGMKAKGFLNSMFRDFVKDDNTLYVFVCGVSGPTSRNGYMTSSAAIFLGDNPLVALSKITIPAFGNDESLATYVALDIALTWLSKNGYKNKVNINCSSFLAYMGLTEKRGIIPKFNVLRIKLLKLRKEFKKITFAYIRSENNILSESICYYILDKNYINGYHTKISRRQNVEFITIAAHIDSKKEWTDYFDEVVEIK